MSIGLVQLSARYSIARHLGHGCGGCHAGTLHGRNRYAESLRQVRDLRARRNARLSRASFRVINSLRSFALAIADEPRATSRTTELDSGVTPTRIRTRRCFRPRNTYLFTLVRRHALRVVSPVV